MNKNLFPFLFLIVLFHACGQQSQPEKQRDSTQERLDSKGTTIAARFSPPRGYHRTSVDSRSFSNYLRKLPLKKKGSQVLYFDGTVKESRTVYHAVIDLPIGSRDLHQCADAVMRLRAEYLYKEKKYDSIHFNFTNGFRADYNNWRKGKRISVSGNKVQWKSGASPSDSYPVFWKYLEMVFSYAGTASLEKEMHPIAIDQMRIGDVFIKGGFPGHAIIVVDMAVNEVSKERMFLLAQSYMPAQEIQLLKNPTNTTLSPWYSTANLNELRTPEWSFKNTHLKRF